MHFASLSLHTHSRLGDQSTSARLWVKLVSAAGFLRLTVQTSAGRSVHACLRIRAVTWYHLGWFCKGECNCTPKFQCSFSASYTDFDVDTGVMSNGWLWSAAGAGHIPDSFYFRFDPSKVGARPSCEGQNTDLSIGLPPYLIV